MKFIAAITFLLMLTTQALDYKYEKKIINSHMIHILYVDNGE